MNTTQLRIIGIGILFLLIFLTGYWLSRSGKPYDTIRMTIHKLTALADIVLLVITVYWIHKTTPIQPAVLAAVIICMVCFIATIITGRIGQHPGRRRIGGHLAIRPDGDFPLAQAPSLPDSPLHRRLVLPCDCSRVRCRAKPGRSIQSRHLI